MHWSCFRAWSGNISCGIAPGHALVQIVGYYGNRLFWGPPLRHRSAPGGGPGRPEQNEQESELTFPPSPGAAAAEDEALGEKYSNGKSPVKPIVVVWNQRK